MNQNEVDVIDHIRNKGLVEEALKVINAKDARSLKVKLNDASWRVKQLAMLEALEEGDMRKANRLASEILDLTEAKKQKVEGHLLVDTRMQVLVAEVENLSDEALYRRAEEIGRAGAKSNLEGDEEAEPRKILDVEDASVQERPGELLPERTGVQTDVATGDNAE